MLTHPIPPVFDSHSQILILGSFPSVKSREAGFFYGHPRNRFWQVISAVYHQPTPVTIEEKRRFLLSAGVALWDVIAACEIKGSADSTIRNVHPNDFNLILTQANISRIFVNGKTALSCYNQYLREQIGKEAICLPSTSPANAAWSLQRLCERWRELILIENKEDSR